MYKRRANRMQISEPTRKIPSYPIDHVPLALLL
jgi:hypothetical protein